MDGSKKNRRKAEDQARASEMKRLGIERQQARCPLCHKVYHADMLDRGFNEHFGSCNNRG